MFDDSFTHVRAVRVRLCSGGRGESSTLVSQALESPDFYQDHIGL